MTHTQLDVLEEMVEGVMGRLEQSSLDLDDQGRFYVSRLLEYGARGRNVEEIKGLLGTPGKVLHVALRERGLPTPNHLRLLGITLYQAGLHFREGLPWELAAAEAGVDQWNASRQFARILGARPTELPTWENAMGRALYFIRTSEAPA